MKVKRHALGGQDWSELVSIEWEQRLPIAYVEVMMYTDIGSILVAT